MGEQLKYIIEQVDKDLRANSRRENGYAQQVSMDLLSFVFGSDPERGKIAETVAMAHGDPGFPETAKCRSVIEDLRSARDYEGLAQVTSYALELAGTSNLLQKIRGYYGRTWMNWQKQN